MFITYFFIDHSLTKVPLMAPPYITLSNILVTSFKSFSHIESDGVIQPSVVIEHPFIDIRPSSSKSLHLGVIFPPIPSTYVNTQFLMVVTNAFPMP